MTEFFSRIQEWLSIVSNFLDHFVSLVNVIWQQMMIIYTGMSLNLFPYILSAGFAIVLFVALIKFVLGR